MIIAIDGPAGAGKGTIARYLAQKFDLDYLDTGLLYRAVALKVMEEKIDIDNKDSIISIAKIIEVKSLNNPALKEEGTASVASRIAVIPEVRQILTEKMRSFCLNVALPYKGVVLDGRDIGTVVCPEANCKLFITASVEIRATRRTIEMEKSNPSEANQHYLGEIIQRDSRDTGRQSSPLIPANNAVTIDTSELTIAQACALAESYLPEVLLYPEEFQ